jgi:hypothetical protein
VLVWPLPSDAKQTSPNTTNIATDRMRFLLMHNPLYAC